jgi:hypothetical protein
MFVGLKPFQQEDMKPEIPEEDGEFDFPNSPFPVFMFSCQKPLFLTEHEF